MSSLKGVKRLFPLNAMRQNLSTMIETYIKQILKRQDEVEIRRSEIAKKFDCVPSQINYVINTRFTIKQGYLVESKRGGGGYIRIREVNLLEDTDNLDTMIDTIGDSLSLRESQSMIQALYQDKIIDKQEERLLQAAVDPDNFKGLSDWENQLRARVLSNMLLTYKFED